MTQKELLYVEDAIEHEKAMIAYLQDMKNKLQKESLVAFTAKEIKMHQEQEKDLTKLMEVQSNE